jgi:hypothetical protein
MFDRMTLGTTTLGTTAPAPGLNVLGPTLSIPPCCKGNPDTALTGYGLAAFPRKLSDSQTT